jgi:hypothetical protein
MTTRTEMARRRQQMNRRIRELIAIRRATRYEREFVRRYSATDEVDLRAS